HLHLEIGQRLVDRLHVIGDLLRFDVRVDHHRVLGGRRGRRQQQQQHQREQPESAHEPVSFQRNHTVSERSGSARRNATTTTTMADSEAASPHASPTRPAATSETAATAAKRSGDAASTATTLTATSARTKK